MKVKVSVKVQSALNKAWDHYTDPSHVILWNFADPSWHCPAVRNDMQVGGIYNARMEAKDGSAGFNFEAIYTEIALYKSFTYVFGDRSINVTFNDLGTETEVNIIFDPELENPIELQKNGWQSILNNFKTYSDSII